MSLDRLSYRHDIKLTPVINVSVEQCVLAVGEVTTYYPASRMNSTVVVFLDTFEKVNSIVQNGIVIQDTFTPIMLLLQLAKKCSCPMFPCSLKMNSCLQRSKVVSQMKKISLGCKSLLLKHVVCFRRQVYMVLKNNAN